MLILPVSFLSLSLFAFASFARIHVSATRYRVEFAVDPGRKWFLEEINRGRSLFLLLCLFVSFFFVCCYCDAARLKTKVFEGKFLFELEFRGNWLEMLFSYFFFIVIPSEKVRMALI